MHIHIDSSLKLTVLREAVECVCDFETDLIADSVRDLAKYSPTSDQFAQTLDEILDMRVRVQLATSFIDNQLNTVALGGKVYLDPQIHEIADKGLEMMEDMLYDAILDPLRHPLIGNNIRHPLIGNSTLESMRQEVTHALERYDTLKLLLEEIRRK